MPNKIVDLNALTYYDEKIKQYISDADDAVTNDLEEQITNETNNRVAADEQINTRIDNIENGTTPAGKLKNPLQFGVSGSLDSYDGSVAGKQITKSTLGLGNVDNTSDMNKPVSNAQSQAIQNAVNGVLGDAGENYNTLGKLEDAIQAETTRATQKENSIDSDLQSFKTSTNQNITQIEEDLSSEGQRITNLENNTIKKTGETNQIIQGGIQIQGDLAVNGTTTTNDTETLAVKDNLIVTNSDKIDIISLSGLGINMNSTKTFGVVYDPSVEELKAGIGTLDNNNEFTFDSGEGFPVTLRDSDSDLTDGNVMMWDNVGKKIVDSSVPANNIAQQDGSYSELGAGTVIPTKITTGDLNTYVGANYWGKVYYAGGDNTLANKPTGVVSFGLYVVRSGDGLTSQILVSSNNSTSDNNSPTIYQRWYDGNSVFSNWEEFVTSNGTYSSLTSGKATTLSRMEIGTSANTNQNWYEIINVTYDTNTYNGISIILVLNGRTIGTQYSGLIEFEARCDTTHWTYTNLKILCGNLRPEDLRYNVDDSNTLHVYLYAPSTTYYISKLSNYEGMSGITVTYPLTLLQSADLPEDLTNATNVNRADYFGDGRAIMRTYTTISSLGVTMPCTTVDIMNAMPTDSFFMTNVEDKTTTVTDVPANYGLLLIWRKGAGNRIEVTYQQSLSEGHQQYEGIWTWNGSEFTAITWQLFAYTNGRYNSMITGGAIATSLSESSDLNNCIPSVVGDVRWWYCSGVGISNTILNTPNQGALNSTFYLSCVKTWQNNQQPTQFRAHQTLFCVAPDGVQLYVRSKDSASGAQLDWSAWKSFAYTDDVQASITWATNDEINALFTASQVQVPTVTTETNAAGGTTYNIDL